MERVGKYELVRELGTQADQPGDTLKLTINRDLQSYAARRLDGVVDAINAAGYGLTLGVHSRIESSWRRVQSRARVGNVYVNRGMTGAVVGVQPLGGEGQSGTGPSPRCGAARRSAQRRHLVRGHAAGGHARDG